MKDWLRRLLASAAIGRRGAASQLALRKALFTLFAALACALLALALGRDEPGTEPSLERPLRPWEAKPQAPLTLPSPLSASPSAAEVDAEASVATSAVATAGSVAEIGSRSLVEPAANEESPAAQAAALAQARPAPVHGYRIQLGVFAGPANALALQQRLADQGLPAGVQSRVVLGPFPDQQTARNAQAALRAAGMEEGMLLPPAKVADQFTRGKKPQSGGKP